MSVDIAVIIILGAFACELIDSSLGMMYGTILSPVLIIAGFDPLVVVPSLLLSQAFSGFIASITHHQLRNVDFSIKSGVTERLRKLGYIGAFRRNMPSDLKVVICVSCFGILATVIASMAAMNIPKAALKTYIGVLVLVMGAILLLGFKFRFSWKKIVGIGILSAFNKGMSGGGFGPVVTSGQLISGRTSKNSIGATTLAEAPMYHRFFDLLDCEGVADMGLGFVIVHWRNYRSNNGAPYHFKI